MATAEGGRVRWNIQGHRRLADSKAAPRSIPSGAISPGVWRAKPGSAIVAEAEAARRIPPRELLVELFKLAGPSIILAGRTGRFTRASCRTTGSRHSSPSSSH